MRTLSVGVSAIVPSLARRAGHAIRCGYAESVIAEPKAIPLAGWADPAVLFAEREAHAPCAFWLDAGADARTGWSFLGVGVPAHTGPDAVPINGSRTGSRGAEEPPLRGGWVGWLDYESGAGHPDAEGPAWMRVESLLAFDHARRRVWAVGAPAEATDAAARVAAAAGAVPLPAPGIAPQEAIARHSPAKYAQNVEACRELIRLGEAYQLCLTTRFRTTGPVDEVAAYLRLRQATPAHHGGFVRIGGRALLSASPEQFLWAEDGRIRTRPIKGTRPRGADAASDEALARELAQSEKERAENVMIVDLCRNDLSRVCDPASIHVDALLQVESYPAVHQLVSTVSGQAAEGTTAGALWAAAFPAGSMTGAPKLSAMTHLARLEGGPRGVYSGCFGYVGDNGGVDLAMVIRSIVADAEGAYVGAGGGITWLSEAQAEVDEVATKARAPLAALGAQLPGAWAQR